MRDTLTTNRLVLRVPTLDDAGDIAKYLGDRDIARMTMSIPNPYFPLAAEFWIMMQRANRRQGKSFNYVITLNGELCGVMDIFTAKSGEREIGYWIGKPFWGQGIATEAAQAILAEGFETLGTDEILAGVFEDNPASVRVLEKLGFEHTKPTEDVYSITRGRRAGGYSLRLTKEGFIKSANEHLEHASA